eukprot:TRINITY_DN9551_c0_g1_i1.p1 TRINITY_DN9551_c0_g1~~TRINITY_DN9551_c0_g1_i1.p1  ORF type:complete len:1169 (+),score=183.21 TRINITY_DN9551_c0_g1_i1:86-3508(+)
MPAGQATFKPISASRSQSAAPPGTLGSSYASGLGTSSGSLGSVGEALQESDRRYSNRSELNRLVQSLRGKGRITTAAPARDPPAVAAQPRPAPRIATSTAGATARPTSQPSRTQPRAHPVTNGKAGGTAVPPQRARSAGDDEFEEFEQSLAAGCDPDDLATRAGNGGPAVPALKMGYRKSTGSQPNAVGQRGFMTKMTREQEETAEFEELEAELQLASARARHSTPARVTPPAASPTPGATTCVERPPEATATAGGDVQRSTVRSTTTPAPRSAALPLDTSVVAVPARTSPRRQTGSPPPTQPMVSTGVAPLAPPKPSRPPILGSTNADLVKPAVRVGPAAPPVLGSASDPVKLAARVGPASPPRISFQSGYTSYTELPGKPVPEGDSSTNTSRSASPAAVSGRGSDGTVKVPQNIVLRNSTGGNSTTTASPPRSSFAARRLAARSSPSPRPSSAAAQTAAAQPAPMCIDAGSSETGEASARTEPAAAPPSTSIPVMRVAKPSVVPTVAANDAPAPLPADTTTTVGPEPTPPSSVATSAATPPVTALKVPAAALQAARRDGGVGVGRSVSSSGPRTSATPPPGNAPRSSPKARRTAAPKRFGLGRATPPSAAETSPAHKADGKAVVHGHGDDKSARLSFSSTARRSASPQQVATSAPYFAKKQSQGNTAQRCSPSPQHRPSAPPKVGSPPGSREASVEIMLSVEQPRPARSSATCAVMSKPSTRLQSSSPPLRSQAIPVRKESAVRRTASPPHVKASVEPQSRRSASPPHRAPPPAASQAPSAPHALSQESHGNESVVLLSPPPSDASPDGQNGTHRQPSLPQDDDVAYLDYIERLVHSLQTHTGSVNDSEQIKFLVSEAAGESATDATAFDKLCNVILPGLRKQAERMDLNERQKSELSRQLSALRDCLLLTTIDTKSTASTDEGNWLLSNDSFQRIGSGAGSLKDAAASNASGKTPRAVRTPASDGAKTPSGRAGAGRMTGTQLTKSLELKIESQDRKLQRQSRQVKSLLQENTELALRLKSLSKESRCRSPTQTAVPVPNPYGGQRRSHTPKFNSLMDKEATNGSFCGSVSRPRTPHSEDRRSKVSTPGGERITPRAQLGSRVHTPGAYVAHSSVPGDLGYMRPAKSPTRVSQPAKR